MTGYELSRNWFDWSFENPEKIKPIHTAIFFFAIEHCNRLGWKKKFGFPSQMVMDAIGVKKFQTYSRALNEIAEWGFLEFVERSKNQYSANIICFALPKKGKAHGKALDKAFIKHRAKHEECSAEKGQSTGQSKGKSKGNGTGIGKDSINKPINQLTNKQERGEIRAIDILKKEKQSELDVLWMQNKKLIDDKKKLVESFNDKMELEVAQNKIKFSAEQLMPRFRSYVRQWISNSQASKTSEQTQTSNRPNYF